MDETKQSVEQLQAEIEKTQVDGEKHHRLQEIKMLVHQIRHQDDGGTEHHHTLKAQLQEALLLFDTEHHELVTAMERTITTLSNSGI